MKNNLSESIKTLTLAFNEAGGPYGHYLEPKQLERLLKENGAYNLVATKLLEMNFDERYIPERAEHVLCYTNAQVRTLLKSAINALEERKTIAELLEDYQQGSRIGYIDSDKEFFVMENKQRYRFNGVAMYQIWEVAKPQVDDWLELVDWEVKNNSALYLSPSMMVKSLITKRMDEQRAALEGFIEMQRRAGRHTIELTSSEWLMMARACEYALSPVLSGLALVDGVDAHAPDIINAIDGKQINGALAVVKENDVPYLRRRETEQGAVWSYALPNL